MNFELTAIIHDASSTSCNAMYEHVYCAGIDKVLHRVLPVQQAQWTVFRSVCLYYSFRRTLLSSPVSIGLSLSINEIHLLLPSLPLSFH